MILTIINAVIAIAKTVPIFDGWLRLLIDSYVDSQVKKIKIETIGKQEKVAAIMASIKKAETHEENAALLASLSDIKRGL
jgi:hypothetical protein